MSNRSDRLAQAVQFLIRNGHAQNQSEIARKIGTSLSSLNMGIHGMREPGIELLLRLSDNYPINFWWLRSGKGDMLEDKQAALRKRIAELEKILEANGLL